MVCHRDALVLALLLTTSTIIGQACERSTPVKPESKIQVPGAVTLTSDENAAENDELAFQLRGDRAATTSFILLHGYGAMGADLIPLADHFARSLKMRFVVAAGPHDQGRGRKWFSLDDMEERKASDTKLSKLITAERKRGAERIIVGGFSQGAMMAAHAGALNSVDALVLFSGATSPLIAKAQGLKGVPVFVSHGTKDRVLPFEKGQALRDDLNEAGAKVEFVEFSGAHTIRPALGKALTFLQALGD